MMILISAGLFFLLLKTTDAYMTFYIPSFVGLGVLIYFLFYFDYINKYFEKLSKKIEKINNSIYNQITKIRKRWGNGKCRKNKKKQLDFPKS